MRCIFCLIALLGCALLGACSGVEDEFFGEEEGGAVIVRNEDVSLRKNFYANGALSSIVHYDKDKNFTGAFYYPDGIPMSVFSRGKVFESSPRLLAIDGRSVDFYPDGTLIDPQIKRDKKFGYYESGEWNFERNGRKHFIDFSARKIGDTYVLAIYLYPESNDGEITERIVITCRKPAEKSEKDALEIGTDCLFNSFKVDCNFSPSRKFENPFIASESARAVPRKILNVKIVDFSDKKTIFNFEFDLTPFLDGKFTR